MTRVLAISAALLIAQAVPAFAETIQLVCQGTGISTVTIAVDLTNKTANLSDAEEQGSVAPARANITDTMITYRLITGPNHYTDVRINRLSGVFLGRYCGNGECGP